MDGRSVGSMRRRRERRLSQILMVLAVLVFFGGLIMQITVRSQISDQSKEIAEIQVKIDRLELDADNLRLFINQHHNLDKIDVLARQLGMEDPMDDQLRVVSLPAIYGDTSTQTVANVSGEEMNG